ncbi:hypothetical protein [Streptomyces sp. H27-D2]|uniref:hypothetical protein n=1 Tax=Streptomyces sp. H27-D2 TaxID=3046304 RepID=UPI002DB951DE|nr:hypothetical protein [Streptomyces sp. H27-D2]MEC4017919.1 hypothetical protein [Streptomyces sp. H27-D2]
MVFLRALVATARMIRHTAHLSAGLPPDDEVLLDAPDGRLAPVLVAAAADDFKPAAELLAATRENAEWESRDRYVTRLAAFTRSRPGWFADWQSADPHSPDAALITAQRAASRTELLPETTLLREVVPLIEAAASADDADPVPWRIALDHARNSRAPRTAFAAHWDQAVRRSSHHYGCHVAALRYLGSRPDSSPAECLDFAENAAAQALPRSLLRALPLRTAYAHLDAAATPHAALADSGMGLGGGGGGSVGRGARTGRRAHRSSGSGVPARAAAGIDERRVDTAADLAIEMSARYEPGDPWPAEVRNLLAYTLVTRSRWADALAQFRLIGPHATSLPWQHISDDPLGQFLEVRDGVRIQLASTIPLRHRPGQEIANDH